MAKAWAVTRRRHRTVQELRNEHVRNRKGNVMPGASEQGARTCAAVCIAPPRPTRRRAAPEAERHDTHTDTVALSRYCRRAVLGQEAARPTSVQCQWAQGA